MQTQHSEEHGSEDCAQPLCHSFKHPWSCSQNEKGEAHFSHPSALKSRHMFKKSTYSFALIYSGSNCIEDSSGKSEAGVPMASHSQETLKGMGVMALKSIRLREALNLEMLLSIFGKGRWGYDLNIVMLKKGTALLLPPWLLFITWNCDSCSFFSTSRHLPWGDVAWPEAQDVEGSPPLGSGIQADWGMSLSKKLQTPKTPKPHPILYIRNSPLLSGFHSGASV